MRKTCDCCGGSGQTGFFQGESRFVITWEECPECCGTGYTEAKDEAKNPVKPPDENKP